MKAFLPIMHGLFLVLYSWVSNNAALVATPFRATRWFFSLFREVRVRGRSAWDRGVPVDYYSVLCVCTVPLEGEWRIGGTDEERVELESLTGLKGKIDHRKIDM